MFVLEVIKSRTEEIKEKLNWCIPDFTITYLDTHTLFRCKFNSLAYTNEETTKFQYIFRHLISLNEPFLLTYENHVVIIGKFKKSNPQEFVCTRYEDTNNTDSYFNWDEQIQLYTTNKLMQITGFKK